MGSTLEGSLSRTDVAKAVLKELVEGLTDDPGLAIALRVYGFLLSGKGLCEDLRLMQDFGPANKGALLFWRLWSPCVRAD